MSADLIKSRIELLSDDEIEVLIVFCQNPGITVGKAITDGLLTWSDSQIRNLERTALGTLRPYTLEEVCPYLLGTAEPEPQVVTGFEDLEPPDEEPLVGTIDPHPVEEEQDWPTWLRIMAGIVILAVLIALCGWSYNWLTNLDNPLEPNAAIPPTVEVTRIEEVVVPAPTWTPFPTVTEVAIVEVIETIEVTETYPPITDTPAPTNTPKPTATLIPLLFEESFEGIPSPDLSIRGDNFTLVDGVLHSKGLMRIFTGSSDWTNYAVLLDLSSSGWAPFPDLSNESAGNGGIEIQLRKQDLFNYIAVQIESFRGYCGVRWVEYIDGQGTEILGTRKNIGEEDLCRSSWKAVADGDEYELYLDSDLIIQFPYDSYDRGSVEIAARGRDTQMTIENFRIEDLK